MNKILSALSGIALLATACTSGTDTGSDERIVEEQAAATSGSASLVYTADWGNGYCAEVTISNGLGQSTARWQVVLDLKTTSISGAWNAKASANTGRSTFGPVDYNTSIPPGGTTKFGFCANAPSSSVRPTLLAWNMESNVYATCATSSGLNPAKAALAVAMGKELGRWTPNSDLTVSNGKVVLSSTGLSKCGSGGCPNTKALLGQQDSGITSFVDQNLFNPTNFSADLQASFGRQANLIINLQQNSPSKLPPSHKLTMVGGPTNFGSGNCGPHYIFQVDNADGSPLTSTQAANMGNALCFYGHGGCGSNPYIGFTQTTVQCPSGRTCVAIDPTDGDNSSTSTTTAGSAPTYPMNRVYDPYNSLLGGSCITLAGRLGTLQSKCGYYPSTCGYLYCIASYY
ncbi:MAG: cellulose binding domain-containing protein [Myxococcota bacterium]